MTGSTERLVILGSTITALAIARECRAMGLPCVLFATSAGPATHSRIPEVHLLESATDEEVLERLLSVAKETRSALIADSDSWLRWIMQHRNILQSVFENILHPANEVLEVCLNKSRFIQWCESKRIPAPTLYEATPGQNRTDMEYPVLLRPQTTRHGADDNLPKAKEISSDEDLDRLLERYRQHNVTATICQSLIRPNVLQYSVAVARNESGDTRVFVAQKIRPSAEKCAGGTYVIASPDTAVAKLSMAAATALGLFGVAEIEIIKYTDTEDLFLIEINPRPWAQFALAWQSGFQFLTFLLDEDSYDKRKERKNGKRWLNLGDDLYVAFSRSEGMVTGKEIAVMDYVKTVVAANVFPIWSWRDPGPWLDSVARRFIRKRLSYRRH